MNNQNRCLGSMQPISPPRLENRLGVSFKGDLFPGLSSTQLTGDELFGHRLRQRIALVAILHLDLTDRQRLKERIAAQNTLLEPDERHRATGDRPPLDDRIPFAYAHHGPVRRLVQAGPVRLGLDSTLKMLGRK